MSQPQLKAALFEIAGFRDVSLELPDCFHAFAFSLCNVYFMMNKITPNFSCSPAPIQNISRGSGLVVPQRRLVLRIL